MPFQVKTLVSDDELLAALLVGPNITKAAVSLGISRAYLYKRLSVPAFSKRLSDAKKDIFEAACENAKLGFSEAIEKLRELKDHEDPKIALSACDQLIEVGGKFLDADKLTRALEDIDKKMQQLSVAGLIDVVSAPEAEPDESGFESEPQSTQSVS